MENRTKRHPTEWVEIFPNPAPGRRLLSTLYKELQELDTTKPPTPSFKNGVQSLGDFSAEEFQYLKSPKKRPTSAVLRERQTKMPPRESLLHPSQQPRSKPQGAACAGHDVEQEEQSSSCSEDSRAQAQWRSSWRFLRGSGPGIDGAQNTATRLLGIHPKDTGSSPKEDTRLTRLLGS